MRKNKIAISIVNYKSYNQIKRLLMAILNSENVSISIIYIVENSNSASELIKLMNYTKSLSLPVKIKKTQKNCGYSGGHNIAYRMIESLRINYEKFLIINPDITFDKACIRKMTANLKGNVGGVMCATKDMNTREILYTSLKLKGMDTEYIKNINSINKCKSDYLAGSFLMVSRGMLRRIGRPFEDYFMYWEDVELSLNIRKLKYRLCSINRVLVYRQENAKIRSLNAIKYSIKNSYKIVEKHPEIFSKINHKQYLIKMHIHYYFQLFYNFFSR